MKILNVTASPHVRQKTDTKSLMLDVVIAMVPTTIFGILYFGFHALLVVAATVAAAVLAEYFYEKLMKLPITIGDCSAIVTGMILALNLPPEIPIWIPVLGAIFAIIVVKQLYGGLGQNFMNPALAARCFLLISFAQAMTGFTDGGGILAAGTAGVSGATPLALIKAGEQAGLSELFLGTIPGTIGEVCKPALLLGAAYLIVRKVISPKIPLIYIATVALFVTVFGGHGLDPYYIACEVCAGGLIFGAFFMATDYVTTPITPNGKVVFAIFIGLLTGIFRIFGASAEGVSYAIIIGNMVVPLIERMTIPKAFGREEKTR